MTRQDTTRTLLGKGESLHLHVRRGTTVLAASGNLRLRCPAIWLAEKMISEQIDLSEGASHAVPRTGWIAITALTAGEVVCVADETRGFQAIIQVWTAAKNRMQRWWRSAAPGTEHS